LESVEKKNKLIEEVGALLQERANLSPLAARIYATLILSSNEGLSFDAVVKQMQASKSSVSSNLNVLLQLRYIAYYTKPGNRKRYFKTSEFYIKNTMEQQIYLIEKELKVVSKINDFNKNNNPEKFKNEKSLGLLFHEHLEDLKNKINSKLEEIKQFQKQL
jgi:DNA-binding transcriptional regulator GbsR (MarR family)